jgi:hypothetical protein
MDDIEKMDYFSLLDIIWAIVILIVIIIFARNTKNKNSLKSHYKYYMFNVYFKLFFAFVFSSYYILSVKGGDTLAYWDGAIKLNHLFFKDSNMYFDQLMNTPNFSMYISHFDMSTGYPPGWIYREPESWFISKLLSVLTFLTFNSYFAVTFILGYISAIASWRIYELVVSYKLHSEKWIAYGVLFVPSVSFWCSGVSKDTVILFLTLFSIYHSFQIIRLDIKSQFKNWFITLICLFFIYQVRPFMLAAILIPLLFSYSIRLVKKYKKSRFKLVLIRLTYIASIVLFVVFQGGNIANSEKLEEVAVINKDFAQNDIYTGQRYDIGITDYSAQGVLIAMPSAIIAGIYRPFPWEAGSLTMILDGVEDFIFIILTVLFFSRSFIWKISLIRSNEFLIYSLVFVLIMAYLAGVTSGLLGVLVRFKTPVIPFLLILLSIKIEKPQMKKPKTNVGLMN